MQTGSPPSRWPAMETSSLMISPLARRQGSNPDPNLLEDGLVEPKRRKSGKRSPLAQRQGEVIGAGDTCVSNHEPRRRKSGQQSQSPRERPAEEPQTSTRSPPAQRQGHEPDPDKHMDRRQGPRRLRSGSQNPTNPKRHRISTQASHKVTWLDEAQQTRDMTVERDKPGFPLWEPTSRVSGAGLNWETEDDIQTPSNPDQDEPLESAINDNTKRTDYSTSAEPNYLRVDETKLDDNMRVAHQRNLERIKLANLADEEIIGKYLPSSTTAFFPCQWTGPEDNIENNQRWLDTLLSVVRMDCPLPTKSEFDFRINDEAISRNAAILSRGGFNMTNVLSSQKGTTVWHGSEFRPTEQLQLFLTDHPSFDYIRTIFEGGMGYHFTSELSESERSDELNAQLERGNHQSALEESERIQELLEKDVKHGFCLPLPVDTVKHIKGAMIQPCGIVSQFTLTSDGERIKKKRLTHDLSFSITDEGMSVNDRIDMSQYPEMVYGWCLLRVIHYIVALRTQHPGQAIYISKFDYSDAYRRISHTAEAAAMTILVVGGIAYLMLRLAFGGSPNPPCFCAFSETLTDLANEISASAYMPHMFRSPTVQSHHLDPVDYGDPDEPLAEAITTAVEIPITATARKDAFIDDIVSVFLGTETNLCREGDIVPLAVHAMSRPHAGDNNEPVPRRQLLQPVKLEAEGRPSESEVVLGWDIDCRKMTVALPNDKFQAWASDLDDIIRSETVVFEQFESLIGRLNHASFVIPLSRHFLNELRWRLEHRKAMRKTSFRLNTSELDDLRLWGTFLNSANKGISMNLLTIRTPTHIAWSDSCPYGLGGYDLQGRAWRIRIPESALFYGCDEANNVLEFLGMGINILLLLQSTKGEAFPCLLVLGDNTSAIAWIFKSGKVSRSSPYYLAVKMIARKIASAIHESNTQLCAQHLRGIYNDVSDLLSFSGEARGYTNPLTKDNPDNTSLTLRIHEHIPQLVPQNFAISHLPSDILCFAITVLQTLESSWTRNKNRVGKNKSDPGDAGNNSSVTLDYWTPSSLEYQEKSNCESPKLSSSDIASLTFTSRVQLLRNVRGQWYHRLSRLPSAMWLRRSGQITAKVPSTTKEAVYDTKI